MRLMFNGQQRVFNGQIVLQARLLYPSSRTTARQLMQHKAV
jgi:hypothetical protein